MSTSESIVGAVVGIVVGVTAAVVTHRALTQGEELLHQEEIEEAERRAYSRGWQDASNSENNVRKAYDRLTSETDETAGTTLRARKS